MATDVVVSSEKVKDPVAVRYAWSDNPGPIDLYNQFGLPAAPFRTDDWPLSTKGNVYSDNPWENNVKRDAMIANMKRITAILDW